MIEITDGEKFAEEVVEPLLHWYDENKRSLPWRDDRQPYRVWLSEIMLQQTRVEAVKPYFDRFVRELPNIKSLAEVSEDKLLKLWEGLGYYNRARNLQKAAKKMVEEYDGSMPDCYELLLTLPGIGSYTAGAIASISFSEAVPAVDGNVMRILTRIFGDTSDITAAGFKKELEELLRKHMPTGRPGDFNQAMMELGATVCVPNGEPKCAACPVSAVCKARQDESWQQIPYKPPGRKRRIEKRTILRIQNGESIVIHKRPSKGLLAGLYEFVNLEGWLSEKEIGQKVEALGFQPLYIERLADSTHIFSHIEWHMQGYLVRIADREFEEKALFTEENEGAYLLAELDEIQRTYAIPSAFHAYML